MSYGFAGRWFTWYLSLVEHYDVIIVGAGLAGLTAALQLSQVGHRVVVFEKQHFPHHKVCGEYVSNEIDGYLEQLGISMAQVGAVTIDTVQLTTTKGTSITQKLPLGGKGISRYALDNLLFEKAVSNNVSFKFHTVSSIVFQEDAFIVKSNENETFTATFVIGAFGKRSSIDKMMERDFISKKSAWLGVKAHYKLESFPKNLVALHNFKGGYGGLSKTETGAVNFCYLTSYASFRRHKNIEAFNAEVVAKNPYLHDFLSKAQPIFKEPLSIAQISFHSKKAVENHVIMCGDSAGLIHPLCGNGMAMAIHSAKIAAELIDTYIKGVEKSRTKIEVRYQILWKKMFGRRLWVSRQLQSALLNENLSNWGLAALTKSPAMLGYLIKSTHGKTLL